MTLPETPANPATPAVPATPATPPAATPPATPPPANPSPTAPNIGEMALEELAKTNPHVARVMQEQADAAAKLAEKEAADEAARVEAAQKNGEWQKLAEEAGQKVTTLNGQITSMKKGLDERDAVIKLILEDKLASIPEERRALIPKEYSAIKQLEYITQNFAALGAEPVQSKGSPVPPNNAGPVTDETKLLAEIQELDAKGANRTFTENKLMVEKAQQLKALRAAKQTK